MPKNTCASANGKGQQPEPTTVSLLEKWTLIHTINADKRLSSSAKVVAVDLMWRMNCKYQTCFPKQSTVADATGLSERTVYAAVQELREYSYLTWRRQSNGVNLYRFIFVYVDRHNDGTPQSPEITAKIAGEDETPPAKSAVEPTAKSAALYNTGKELSREEISEPLTPSASEAREQSPKKPLASAETKPLQEGSAEWWKERVWNETGPRFKERFYPTVSKAAFKKRLGEALRREQWNIEPVDRAMRAALDAEPALDAWEYVTGVLRKRRLGPADRSAPISVRGVM